MVSKLQFFSIYSFLYVLLDPHRNFHVGKELTFFIFSNARYVVYVHLCFLTLVGLKTNSSSDYP